MNSTHTSRLSYLEFFNQNFGKNDLLEVESSRPKFITSRSVLFVEIAIIFVILLIFWLRKLSSICQKNNCVEIRGDVTKSGAVPTASYFPIPVPNIVNSFYAMYKLQKDGLKFFEDLNSKLGNLFLVPFPTQNLLLVLDPSIIQKILTSSNAKHLNKPRFFYDRIFISAFRDGLVASDYELWTIHRKILNRCFTYKSFQSYLPFMNAHGKTLVKQLQSLCSVDTVQGKQVYDLIWSETIKIILQTICGIDVCSDEDSRQIHDEFKKGKMILQYRFLHPYLLLEPIWNLHPMKKELDEVTESLSQIAYREIERYRKNEEMGKIIKEGGDDLSEDITSDEEDTTDGTKKFKCIIEEMVRFGASNKEIYDEFATFVSTGHETTSLAINQLLFHLASNPKCQDLCREEIDRLLESVSEVGDEMNYNLTMDDLSNLKYLERCIYEGLRLTTTTPIFLRQLEESMKVDEDLTIKGGTTVAFLPWVVHRDPKNFPNPLEFDPDRFLPENVKARHPYLFMPFSGGQRNCIGYKYAIMEMKVILTWLIRNFDVYTKDKPDDINYFLELVLLPGKEISIMLKKRKFPPSN